MLGEKVKNKVRMVKGSRAEVREVGRSPEVVIVRSCKEFMSPQQMVLSSLRLCL